MNVGRSNVRHLQHPQTNIQIDVMTRVYNLY